MKNKLVYFDNASTTPISPKVLSEMIPWLKDGYGNPSSLYQIGRDSKVAIEKARAQVAKAINADPDEIFFTSGGTEANNWAISLVPHGNYILTSRIEHHAILNTIKNFDESAALFFDTNKDGIVAEVDESSADFCVFKYYPALCTVMLVNNELGTVQPVERLFKDFKRPGILTHTDAVQAVGHIHVDVKELGVDLLSMSAHKFNGPKGIGALYVRKGTDLHPFICGGMQERGMRASTENVPNIVGMGVAIEEAVQNIDEYQDHVYELKKYFIQCLNAERIDFVQTVPLNHSGILSVRFPGIDSETLLLNLDLFGICASAGSACNTESIEPSHVLKAIGLKDSEAYSTIRFSFGLQNNFSEIRYVVQKLKDCINIIREAGEAS